MISTAAELAEALARATGGETFDLAPGNYGRLSIRRRSFAPPIVIRGGTFTEVYIAETVGVRLTGYVLDFVPTETTTSNSQAVRIIDSQGIDLDGGLITGGPAINGIAQDAPLGTPGSGEVIGLPTGKAINIERSKAIGIIGNDITQFHKAITFDRCDGLTIANNDIHDLRTTPVSGSDTGNLTIERNHTWNSTPWRFSGAGDHGDMIHLFSTSAHPGPLKGLRILDNLLEQGDGAALIGIFLQQKTGEGYAEAEITGNLILTSHLHGIWLGAVTGVVAENRALWTGHGDVNDQPAILNKGPEAGLSIVGNVAAPTSSPAPGNYWRATTPEEAADARVAWLARFRDAEPPVEEPVPPPPPDPEPPVSADKDRLLKAREEALAVVNAARRSLYQIDMLLGAEG